MLTTTHIDRQFQNISRLARKTLRRHRSSNICTNAVWFVDPVRGAESGTALPAFERKSPLRPGEKK